MGIFAQKPKSFKIDRKSPLASHLCSSISRVLLRFLGDYTDDVLAEYVTLLVCNGKHQYQAREDLEAFLGERSAEFVSWLWDLLLKCSSQKNTSTDILYLTDVTVSNCCDAITDRCMNAHRSVDIEKYDDGGTDRSLTKDEKFYRLSVETCNHVDSNDMKLTEGSICHRDVVETSDDFNYDNIQSVACENKVHGRINSTEYIHDDSLTCKQGSNFIPNGREGKILHMDEFNGAIDDSKSNGSPNQFLDFPRRESGSRNLQSYIIGNSCSGHIPATNISARSLSSNQQNDRSRRSVWDRLGKPCENVSASCKPDVCRDHTIDQEEEEVLAQRSLLFSVPFDVKNRNLAEAAGLGIKCRGQNQSGEYRKSDHGAGARCGLQVASNIRQKRHFGEINMNTATGSGGLAGKRNLGLQHEKFSQDLKKSKLISEASKTVNSNLVSVCSLSEAHPDSINSDKNMVENLKPVQAQVQDVKLKMRQIEMEMSKLRSKQLEMKKGGKSNSFPGYGALKHSEEDMESRTVIVTNVHFAATKEALSKYFSKCGVVANIVILADKATSHIKGSAYVTFASKESVDKAVAWSGTTFFSRTLKVVRKAEETSVRSAAAPVGGKGPAQFSYINRKATFDRPFHSGCHLQWRRDSVPSALEASASTSVEDKGAASSASQQQL